MNPNLNETHDPNLKSWVESANDPNSDFPIQNLPFVVFRPEDWDPSGLLPNIGVRIGDFVLDLSALEHGQKWLNLQSPIPLFADRDLSMATFYLPRDNLAARLRRQLVDLLNVRQLQVRHAIESERMLLPWDQCRPVRPLDIPNYTDFYASIYHATTVGTMFRPDNPLLPNYKHVPIGYHGRASSIVVSGTDIRRPSGQQAPPDDSPGASPTFGPCKMLDYELELGAFIGPGNAMGEPIPIAKAREHIFGLCLLNDWSARDIQKWEYQPLGPFLAKNFATSISPYIVTLEALEPFRAPGFTRGPGDPNPLAYLDDENDRRWGGFDITLEVYLQSADMAKRGLSPVRLSRGSFKDMFWSFPQMVAHHTSNGCNLQPGDLLGSGTISGPGPESRGCLLELTWQGYSQGGGPNKKPLPRRPIELPTGEKRTFLADGDTVIFKAFCERDGFRRIGFGECRGTIKPAR